MQRIVRVAVITVTVALVVGSLFNILLGHRDIAVVFALAAPLGVSSWGFARAGQHEAAVVLLSAVLVAAVSLALYMAPMGAHDHAVIAYAGVILFNALLLSRPRFILMAGGTLAVATLVFILEFNGLTNSRPGLGAGWPALVEFLAITAILGVLGRMVAEILFGSIGDAQQSSVKDSATGLNNRARFLATMGARMRTADTDTFGVLALADLVNFRRVNHVVGFVAADRLLAECGRRAAAVSPGALVGRVGDDEFALFALDLRNSDEAREVCRQLQAALTFEYQGVDVKCAAGHAVFPRDATDASALWLAADAALDETKAQPRSRPSERA